MKSDDSYSYAQIKHINYFTEEYVKQLLQKQTSKQLSSLNPFVSTIYFPSAQFPDLEAYEATVQFQATTYVGLMEFLMPLDSAALLDSGKPSYTRLRFTLDGVPRIYVQVSGGDIDNGSGTLSFLEYVQSLFPKMNVEIPYNFAAIHVLSDISIDGAEFDPGDIGTPGFTNTGFTSGSHTPGFEFHIQVSGYSAILQ